MALLILVIIAAAVVVLARGGVSEAVELVVDCYRLADLLLPVIRGRISPSPLLLPE